MKKYLRLTISKAFISILLISILCLGFLLYKSKESVVYKTNYVLVTPTLLPSPTSYPFDKNISGSIEMALSYPSESIPNGMALCALDLDEKIIYCNEKVIHNTTRYKNGDGIILNVPEGNYNVFVKYGESPNQFSYYYYTNYSKACAVFSSIIEMPNTDNCSSFSSEIKKETVSVKDKSNLYLGTGIDWSNSRSLNF